MENTFQIERINNTVYTTISVKPRFYAYILLGTVLLVLGIPFVTFEFTPDVIMVTITFLTLWILFPVKYALWNIFGTEKLIITNKSVSYQYNYGFVESRLLSKTFNDLTITFKNKIDNLGEVYFLNEDSNTGLEKILHKTSIYISKKQYDILVDEIFNIKIETDYFSLN